jgi:peptidoglycan/LPS O-acetylase OafA/YrhL
MTALRHRDDIDGLRAVAILPITLFHAGVAALAGGFVGVDIFFVISGYLITSIVLRDMAADRFTLAGFYRRRVVRIFPALFAMLILVLAWSAVMLLPAEFERLAESAMAATGFASNLYFWRTSDYFNPAAELMPLLHTWSLGVEEQFYIFYPLFLLLLTRVWARGVRPLLPILTLASLLLGGLVALRSPIGAFYLLPCRAWELLLGASLAAGMFPAVASRADRQALALIGLLLVVAAVFVVRPGPYFPVPLALLPCVGTALLIGYGEDTAVGRALSWAPLRWIGRISYSVYLWHWPIIALYRIETGVALDGLETALLVLASIAAGALSYYAVERPFMRRFREAGSSGRIVAGGLAAVATGIAAMFLLSATAPAWRQIDPEVARIAAYDDYLERAEYRYQFRRGPCFRGEAERGIPFVPAECLALDPARPNVVILGDSYAAQYWRAFALRYPERNVMQANASGCRPLLGGGGEARCREVVDHVLGPLLSTGRVATVVLAARWLDDELEALPATIRRIQQAGARVVVIGPTVEYEGEFPSILARSLAKRDPSYVGRWRVHDREAQDARIAALVAPTGAAYVSPLRLLCPQGRCLLRTADGGPMQFDYGHLTLAGSRYVVDRMPPL